MPAILRIAPPGPSGKILGQSAAAVALTGSTNETTLATIAIPPGALKTGGRLQVYTLWSMPGSTNTKTKKIKLGSTAFLSLATATNTILSFARQLDIFARGRTSQIAMAAGVAGAGLGQQTLANTTGAEDLDTALNLTITGQLSSSGETLTLETYSVVLINP